MSDPRLRGCMADREGPLALSRCGRQKSVTAEEVFHGGRRKPLRLWFRSMWHVTSRKDGTSVLGVQRILGMGVATQAVPRDGTREPGQAGRMRKLNKVYSGASRPGRRGRGAEGKTLVAAAVRHGSGGGIGRIPLGIVSDT